MKSCLYEGRVFHRRLSPRPHAFALGMFQVYLDLEELDEVFRGRWFWSTRRPALVRFRREDYHGPREVPLAEAVRDTLERELGERPPGPVRLLTHLRTWGYSFNPVSFYYAYEADGQTLHSVLAEITNTPWGERYSYALRSEDGRGVRSDFDKAFHVSPFFDIDQQYRWTFPLPDERLRVRMENREQGALVFEAGVDLERRPITGRSLARMLLRYPAMPAIGHAAIYWHALRLWLKRTPFFTHPAKRPALASRRGLHS